MSYKDEAKTNLGIIGSTERVNVAGIEDIPAKIDTGADSSSIWASHIRMDKDGTLNFRLFDEGSPYYTGKECSRKDYQVAVVRSSSGHEQIRYRTRLRLVLGGRVINALFNLSDRSNNTFPVLIGRRTISRKFIVDVSKKRANIKSNSFKTKRIQRQLTADPYEFHRQYIEKRTTNLDTVKSKTERSLA